MDLEARNLRAAANRLFNRYLAGEPPEALAGLAALPLFLSLRAAIRAKVEAAGADRLEGEGRTRARALARDYFDRAAGFLRYAPPRLVCVGGLSGAGKSALAGALSPQIGRAPGALWLRSDVERKAMFGVEEVARLPDSAYAAESSLEVYRRIEDKARRALKAAHAVVLDATFSAARERAAAAGIAAELGVAFDGLFLEAPLEARLARVAAPPRRRIGCGRFRRALAAGRAAARARMVAARRFGQPRQHGRFGFEAHRGRSAIRRWIFTGEALTNHGISSL